MDPADIPLRDIHLPDPVSWWPLAPGWWVLVGCVLACVLIGLGWWWRSRRRRIISATLREFAAIEQRYTEHGDTHELARELSRLARRATLAMEPERGIAAATGDRWHAALDRATTTGEAGEVLKRALIEAPYRRNMTIDGNALIAAFKQWIGELRTVPVRAR